MAKKEAKTEVKAVPKQTVPQKAPFQKSHQNAKPDSKGITTTREQDMAEWYSQAVLKAEVADYAPVKGCMIIRPYGYAMWELMQEYFNERLKELGVQNAYFPLFIPESFFHREAQHAQGFKPEVAWIANKYEGERIAVRPTSETIIYDSFSKWIRSHRDLPYLINQWCNVVRWETEATKIFLRTREFLWQEGHCAFSTDKECEDHTYMILEEYRKLAEDVLAIPVVKGRKTPKETFAGAKFSLTIEAFMPDGKALQCGTSHHLGQGFAKSFDIKYYGEDKEEHHVYQNSWGFSTRLIGALLMQHGDNKGLVLPPRIAPIQAVVVPIIFEDSKSKVVAFAEDVRKKLREYRTHLDAREEYSAGWKFNLYEMKGVPLRIEVGPKDVEKKQVVIVRRDTGEKKMVPAADVEKTVALLLDEIHTNLFNRAKAYHKEHMTEVDTWDQFLKVVNASKVALAPWCGVTSCEAEIKEKTSGVSSRCIPFETKLGKGKNCVHCGKPAKEIVLFSRSY